MMGVSAIAVIFLLCFTGAATGLLAFLVGRDAGMRAENAMNRDVSEAVIKMLQKSVSCLQESSKAERLALQQWLAQCPALLPGKDNGNGDKTKQVE